MKYFIVTFGCQQNVSDSERIASYYEARGYKKSKSKGDADDIIINTCMIRESAENRVYGLVHNLTKEKLSGRKLKIVITGCMVGMAVREKTGKMLDLLRKKMPGVDEFLPIEEVGFDFAPVRSSSEHAYVPISNGCNNFCTYCVVPFTRGREMSRPIDDILNECHDLVVKGFKHITLLGQNVNSYGADILVSGDKLQHKRDISERKYFSQKAISTNQLRQLRPDNQKVESNYKPTYVKHLGRLRIPTLFPELLRRVGEINGLEKLDFISSNPWDFSDDLISVISENPRISREIHLPVQSGDDKVLQNMNRWYSSKEYLDLVGKLKKSVPGIKLSTDIIVGFCGETEEQFENTVDLAKKVGFSKAYISIYSDRPLTAAHKVLKDDIPFKEKKRRWQILENLIRQTKP